MSLDEDRKLTGDTGGYETDLFMNVQLAKYLCRVEEMLIVEDPGAPRH